jgi:hypothetical protein
MGISSILLWAALSTAEGGITGPDISGTVVPAAAPGAAAPATGLANLGTALNGTGRIATLELRSAGIDVASVAGKKELVVRQQVAERQATTTTTPNGLSELDYQKIEPALDACRIEIARRRRSAVTDVAAGSVTLRWTVEASGRVRDAEALSAQNTDLEVAACAKRVVADWVFGKPPGGGAVTVERTYTFR